MSRPKKIKQTFDDFKYYIVQNKNGVLIPMMCSNSDEVISDLIVISKYENWIIYENGLDVTKKFRKMKLKKGDKNVK